MIFRRKRKSLEAVVVRITPDPAQAAELERRMNSLAYYPENGFHRDRVQDRIEQTTPSLLRRQAS